MSEYTFYPKRTDSVAALQFDGFQRTAQDISRALGKHATLSVAPVGRMSDLNTSAQLVVGETDAVVPRGYYVVINPATRELVEVLDPESFFDKYSKDGL